MNQAESAAIPKSCVYFYGRGRIYGRDCCVDLVVVLLHD